MKINKIEDLIKTYSDYPKPGIIFFDLNSLFSSVEWNECIATLAKDCTKSHSKITHIIGIESSIMALSHLPMLRLYQAYQDYLRQAAL